MVYVVPQLYKEAFSAQPCGAVSHDGGGNLGGSMIPTVPSLRA